MFFTRNSELSGRMDLLQNKAAILINVSPLSLSLFFSVPLSPLSLSLSFYSLCPSLSPLSLSISLFLSVPLSPFSKYLPALLDPNPSAGPEKKVPYFKQLLRPPPPSLFLQIHPNFIPLLCAQSVKL